MATFWASLENVTFKKKTFDYRLDNFCKKGYFLFQHLVTLRLTLSRSHEWHHFWKDSQWPNWHYGQAVQANKQSRCQWLNCRHHLRRNLQNLWLVLFLNFFRRSLGIGFKPTPLTCQLSTVKCIQFIQHKVSDVCYFCSKFWHWLFLPWLMGVAGTAAQKILISEGEAILPTYLHNETATSLRKSLEWRT